MKVLLLSAYAARSHGYWQRALQAMFPGWEWTVLELPPRHFSWRVRGNALYWSMQERPTLERSYDLLLATSMVDLATLRGLVPALAGLRTLVYFHENQFEYPPGERRHSLLDAQLTSIYTALAADRLLFNSSYNMESFLAGAASLLTRLPDRVPPGVEAVLRRKASVLPVPVDLEQVTAVAANWPAKLPASTDAPVRLLWVGRLEHDKGGGGLLRILRELERAEFDFELAVVGQQFRRMPDAFADIASRFESRLVQFGFVEAESDYRALLRGAEIVLSTALHEFQGVAVMEAVAAGCAPVVPNRLSYAEIYPAHAQYECYPDDPEREAQAAAALIQQRAVQLRQGAIEQVDIAAFGRERLLPRYSAVLQAGGAPAA